MVNGKEATVSDEAVEVDVSMGYLFSTGICGSRQLEKHIPPGFTQGIQVSAVFNN